MTAAATDLIDIGVNLTHKSFQQDLDAVLTRAGAAGVSHLVVTGTSLPGSLAACELASRYRQLSATAGVHPHDAQHASPAVLTQLRALSQHDEVVAVGECGLDYNRDFSPRPDQRRCFEAQLQLAADTGLPVFLHERDAHEDFLAMLRAARPSLSAAVVHCFTGTTQELCSYLELDVHIGITGWICDERRGQHLREAVTRIPKGRLMLETDAPFLLPRDLKPKPKSRRNEPRWLPHIAATVAHCRGESALSCGQEASATTRAFFGLGD